MEEKKSTEIQTVSADKISTMVNGYFSREEIAVVKATVAKGTTDTELAYFLSIAKAVGLSPMNKEIWCYKDNRNNLLVFAGRDGFLKKAQESPLWNGLTSASVYTNDDFKMDVANGKITHLTGFQDRGKILGAYAISKPKGCEYPTVEWADFATYNKGQFVWKDFPDAMIKKVAETHCLKNAYGITGLQSEYDFVVKGDVVEPVTKDEIELLKDEIVELLEKYTGDKTVIRDICKEKEASKEFTAAFAQQMIAELKAAQGE